MVLGFIAAGFIAAFSTTGGLALAGAPLWMILLSYPLAGAIAVIGSAAIFYAFNNDDYSDPRDAVHLDAMAIAAE